MAAAMSAPPLDDSLNFTSGLDNPHHINNNNNNNNNMAGDDDNSQHTVELPRAVASMERNGSSSGPHINSNSDLMPPPAKNMSRVGMNKNKVKLAVTTPSQEDLHSRWAEMQDPSSVINSNSFKAQQEQQRLQTNSQPANDKAHDHIEEVGEEEKTVPYYVEPAPRPLFYDTVVRDFAYPLHQVLHHGSYDHGPEDDDIPSDDPDFSSEWGNGDQPGPYRRLSDSAESSTFNTGIGGGGPHWTHGIWGGDGGMYEDMEPLPSTSFRTSDHDDEGTNTHSTKKQHRKSRSFADSPSYERGRRRVESNASKRGSYHGSEGVHSDPAGREALRASRGMEPAEGLDEDMYALSLSHQPTSDRHRTRRDSHVATLPSRAFHEAQRAEDDPRTMSDLPLDLEDVQHSSPQRESLGPEDEELFAGPSLVLYDFEPENPNELRIQEREIIMVSYRHGLGWLVAENEKGDRGLVPEEYVRLLSEMEEWEGVE